MNSLVFMDEKKRSLQTPSQSEVTLTLELRAQEHKFHSCFSIAIEACDCSIQTEPGNSEHKALSLDTLMLESIR